MALVITIILASSAYLCASLCLIHGGRLGAHVVWHDDGVGATPGHLMDTVDFPRLEAHATRLGARLEVGVVPARRTWVVIAGA